MAISLLLLAIYGIATKLHERAVAWSGESPYMAMASMPSNDIDAVVARIVAMQGLHADLGRPVGRSDTESTDGVLVEKVANDMNEAGTLVVHFTANMTTVQFIQKRIDRFGTSMGVIPNRDGLILLRLSKNGSFLFL